MDSKLDGVSRGVWFIVMMMIIGRRSSRRRRGARSTRRRWRGMCGSCSATSPPRRPSGRTSTPGEAGKGLTHIKITS
jgi:hypothetical protein